MADKKNTLRFVWEKERDECDKILSKIDCLPNDTIDDIFKATKRDGIRNRTKKALRFF